MASGSIDDRRSDTMAQSDAYIDKEITEHYRETRARQDDDGLTDANGRPMYPFKDDGTLDVPGDDSDDQDALWNSGLGTESIRASTAFVRRV
jgi:hypothetical protein